MVAALGHDSATYFELAIPTTLSLHNSPSLARSRSALPGVVPVYSRARGEVSGVPNAVGGPYHKAAYQ